MKKVVAVVVLLLVLGAVAWWVLKDRPEADAPYAEAMLEGLDKAGIQRVEGDFRTMHQALTNYAASQGSYPEGNLGKSLKGFLTRIPSRDPWGTPFRYERLGDEDYLLESAGQDGKFGTEDDIISETGSITSPSRWR